MNSKSIILKSLALSLLLSANVRPVDAVTPAVEIVAQAPSRFSWIAEGARNGFTSIQQAGSSWFNTARTFVTENPRTLAYGAAGAIATGAGVYGASKLYKNRKEAGEAAIAAAGYRYIAAVDKLTKFRAEHPTATKVALGASATALLATGITLLARKTDYLAQALDFISTAQMPSIKISSMSMPAFLTKITLPSTEKVATFVENNSTKLVAATGTAAIAAGSVVNQFVSSRKPNEDELVALCRQLPNASEAEKALILTAIDAKVRERNNNTIHTAIYGDANLQITGVVNAVGTVNFESQLIELTRTIAATKAS